MQNIMSEMSYAKCWNIMLNMQIVCSKYKKCSYIMLKSRDIHTCSNSELYNVVIIHRAQDKRWATDSDQFCFMSDHFSTISSQVWLKIDCFTMLSWPLSWLIVSTAYWYIQQKQVWYFISKYQLGLRHSRALLAGIFSDSVGIMSSCSLLAFLLSVSLTSSCLHCLC